MLDKIKRLEYKHYIHELRDVRMVGLLAFGVVVVLVTWSSISVIQTNYELQKQISKLDQEVDLGELENSNLKLRNQYFDTDQYLELQARKQFNMAAPGEKMLIVPKNVALAHTIDTDKKTNQESVTSEIDKPFYQANFEAWMDFVFRRN
jgi:cell division protein FtsB